jgi:DNA-binding GntR family transcriptional regulator
VTAADVDRYSGLSLEFHSVIWENAGNRVLFELNRQLTRRSLKLRLIAMRLPGRASESLASHEQLFEAIRNRDGRSAEKLRWLAVHRAKRALLSVYFGQALRPEDRTELERDLPDLGDSILRFAAGVQATR